eukprot:COSAG02_NODE_123_length_35269_cov_51.697526_12_plen_53_part_00
MERRDHVGPEQWVDLNVVRSRGAVHARGQLVHGMGKNSSVALDCNYIAWQRR